MYAMKLPAHSCCADVNTPQLLTQQSIGHFYAPHTSATSFHLVSHFVIELLNRLYPVVHL